MNFERGRSIKESLSIGKFNLIDKIESVTPHGWKRYDETKFPLLADQSWYLRVMGDIHYASLVSVESIKKEFARGHYDEALKQKSKYHYRIYYVTSRGNNGISTIENWTDDKL